MSPFPLVPRCCGDAMLEIRDPDECPPRGRCWRCCRCQRQHVETAQAVAGGVHARDPRFRGVVRRRRRFEARIASGRRGRWVYLGLFATVEEAAAARARALAERAA